MDIFKIAQAAETLVKRANETAYVKQHEREWKREDREDDLAQTRAELAAPRLIGLFVEVKPFLDTFAQGVADKRQILHMAQRNIVRPIGRKETRPYARHDRRKQGKDRGKFAQYYWTKQTSIGLDPGYAAGYESVTSADVPQGRYYKPQYDEARRMGTRKGSAFSGMAAPRIRDTVTAKPVKRAACAVAQTIAHTPFIPPTPRQGHIPGAK